MRARIIGGLAALGVALASTCPTLTQTVYIPVIAQPTSLPPTTITIDAYTPPAGGSQYTGPKPWESGPIITSTVYVAPTPDSSIASIPGNIDGNPPATTLPGGQVTPGAPGGNGQGTRTVYTFPAGETPPSFPWNPTDPGTNSDGVVVFSTTLYHTRPGSGGTPTVDSLVTCFTVTFPSGADSGNTPGAPVGGGSVSTVVVPTMVPGPDGSLSYSFQTLLSTFPPGVGNGVPPATVVTTTYTMPADAQDPTAGTPVIATLTLTFPQPPATDGSQPPAAPGVPGSSPSGPSTITVIQPPGAPGSAPSGPSTVTVIQPPGVPGSAPSGPATATVIQPSPSSPGVSGPAVPVGPSTITVFQPSASSPAGSIVTVFMTSDTPPAGGFPGSPGVSQSDSIPGGYGDSSPSAGLASAVTVTLPAGSGSGSGSGSQDPAGAAPVTVTVPAGSGSDSGTGSQDPAGAAPVTVTVPAGSVPAISSMEPSSTETSSSVLTSTLVNVISEATTTYSFPFESLVTSISVITVSPADPGNAAGGSPSSASASASVVVSASTVASTVVSSAVDNVQSSLLLSTLVQVITTTPTATAGAALERRAFQNATAPISAATPMCTGTTEVGTLSLDFDDLSVGPVYNPYHRFWFSKGFLVGPPPSDPYLPSSGGRLVEFVPPMLSNTTGFSGDTAQIGMGKTASSPCFQFDFYGMNLGCDSRIAGQLCEFTFTGYQWDAALSNETEFASQTAWVPSCPAMKECPLTVFKATGFSGLSSITITLRVDGQPRTWWADDLLVGWSKNDCESAACRQQTVVDVMTIENGPVWYWTSLGMRLLKPSRVSKHL
ncbi:hypothetical protein CKAH01_12616 [Colletotrichum kahawae]|uniref:DUF7371 domain-containing protein n=1 Tax=Colletotrichum kahawae TaxID=34407 RepID=A0AAE0DEZ6_COLKA|nr:hypothetical protein CKAH01_12616 [Colletotrichum kahawae]